MLTKRSLLLWWALAVVAWAVYIALVTGLGYTSMTQVCIQGAITISLTVWAMLCTVGAAWRRRDADYMRAVLDATIRGMLASGMLQPGEDLERLTVVPAERRHRDGAAAA